MAPGLQVGQPSSSLCTFPISRLPSDWCGRNGVALVPGMEHVHFLNILLQLKNLKQIQNNSVL